MKTPHEIAADYLTAWNTPDSSERARALSGWTEDACYRDPMMGADGRDSISAMIAAARAQFPGHSFTLTGTPDGHDPFVRFSWTLVSADGAAAARGTDIVRVDSQGRIAEVIGFLDHRTS